MPHTWRVLPALQTALAVIFDVELERKAALPDAPAYTTTRRAYHLNVVGAVGGYLDSDRPVSSFRNQLARAVVEAFPEAFYRGMADAGAGETEDDDEQWLTDRINAEIEHVNQLFEALKAKRGAGNLDVDAEVTARADGYAATLDGVYAEGKLRGKDRVMLTFDGDDGQESCRECQKYKGQRHSARWWIKRDLVRRNGNPNYTCGRWAPCQHHFYTDDGDMYAP